MKPIMSESPLGFFRRCLPWLGSDRAGAAGSDQASYYTRILWRIEKGGTPGYLIGICDELDLVAGGRNHEELAVRIQDAMGLLIEHLMENGSLEAYLLERGVEISRTHESGAVESSRVYAPCLFVEGRNDSQQALA